MNISKNRSDSTFLLRAVGYGFLLFSFIHIVDIFIPPQFKNPAWEFAAMALLLERIPLVLVGLALVFWGGLTARKRLEILILKLFSWLTLVAGILSFLLIPFGTSAFVRLSEQSASQISSQYDQQIAQLEQIQARLDGTNSDDLQRFLDSAQAQDPQLNASTPQDLKNQLTGQINEARQNAIRSRETRQRQEKLGLQKNIMKWSLISLISCFLFVYIWHVTSWARQSKIPK